MQERLSAYFISFVVCNERLMILSNQIMIKTRCFCFYYVVDSSDRLSCQINYGSNFDKRKVVPFFVTSVANCV